MFKAIGFDLDGTLIKWPNSWDALRKKLNLPEEYKYRIEEIGYHKAKSLELDCWKKIGVRKRDVEEALKDFELVDRVTECFPLLESRYKIGLITGAPDVIANKVAKLLGIQYVFCNRIIFNKNGSVENFILEVDGFNKGTNLEKFMHEIGAKKSETICVGDAENDISMFRSSGLSIALNPKNEKTSESADIVVNGDFCDLMKAIKRKENIK